MGRSAELYSTTAQWGSNAANVPNSDRLPFHPDVVLRRLPIEDRPQVAGRGLAAFDGHSAAVVILDRAGNVDSKRHGRRMRRHEALRRPDPIGRHACVSDPARKLVIVKIDQMTPKAFPLARPFVLPEAYVAIAAKDSGRIDFAPSSVTAAGDSRHVGKRQAVGAPVRRKIRDTWRGWPAYGPVPASHSRNWRKVAGL